MKKKYIPLISIFLIMGLVVAPGINAKILSIRNTQTNNKKEYKPVLDAVTFVKSYDNLIEDDANAVKQTYDGGYIVVGTSDNGETSNRYREIWVIKTDAFGSVEWSQKYYRGDWSEGFDIEQTKDGGYIIAGLTGDYEEFITNCWIIKTDSQGNIEWDRTYKGGGLEKATSIVEVDDGYVFVANYLTKSQEQIYTAIIKINTLGDKLWKRNIMYTFSDYDPCSIQKTSDYGFIVVGSVERNSEDFDIWLLKTDSNGYKEWEKFYGRSEDEFGYSVKQTSDGGYIIAGKVSNEQDPFVTDAYIIKTDLYGNIEWEKTMGDGENVWFANDIVETFDGGFVTIGFKVKTFDNAHPFLTKLESNGETAWSKTLTYLAFESGNSIEQTSDGGFIIAGYTGYMAPPSFDFWLVKTDENGNTPRARHPMIENHPLFSRILSFLLKI